MLEKISRRRRRRRRSYSRRRRMCNCINLLCILERTEHRIEK